MKILVFTLLMLVPYCTVLSQSSRCDLYGYNYCYLKYEVDASGNRIYGIDGQPRLTTFSSNAPLSEPHLLRAPTIPLSLCYTSDLTIKTLFKKQLAWCDDHPTDYNLFATFLRATLNSVISEVANQLDVCSYTDNPSPLLVQIDNCFDFPDLMESGINMRFTENMVNLNATAEATGGWTNKWGMPTQRMLNINISDHYIHGKKIYPKREFCFSGDCKSCTYRTVYDEPRCLDLRRILLHEIGHYLGLAHINECMTEEQYPPNPFEYIEEVMNDHLNCLNYNEYGMSCYMECALRKLYCPELANFTGSTQSTALPPCQQPTSVALPWQPSRFSMEVYPTVVHDRLSYILKNVRGFTDIKIVDGNGRVVMNEVNEPRPSIDGAIDVDGIPSGYYFIIASDGVSIQVAPIIVRK